MKRHFPGLHLESKNGNDVLEGVFLVRVAHASYRWHREKPFFALQFSILEPKEHAGRTLSGRLYCTPKALWKLNWFLRDFGYDHELFTRDEVDEKVLRPSRSPSNLSHDTQWPVVSESGSLRTGNRLGRISLGRSRIRPKGGRKQ